MKTVRVVLVGIALSACSSGTPKLTSNGFSLVARDEGFALLSPDGGVLLDSATGLTGAYAPVATRTNQVRIEEMYGSFRFTEGTQPWTEGHTVVISGTEANVADGVATLKLVDGPDGVVGLNIQATGVNRVSLAFACHADDAFDGFGEQSDALNHHGHTIPIWASEPGIGKADTDTDPDLWFLVGARHASSYAMPTWLSNRGFIAAVEFDGRTVFELCSVQSDAFRIEVWGTGTTLWLYMGTPQVALDRATAGILGRPMQPPAMAFAPWNDAIFGADTVLATAAELRDAGIASSVIWTEDFRGGVDGGQGYRIADEWDVDTTLYPDAGDISATLNDAGFDWHAYFSSFITSGTHIYDEAIDGGYFVGSPDGGFYLFDGASFTPTGLVDFSNPAAREWMKVHMRRAMDDGFTGWMADFGEWLPADSVFFDGGDPMLAHNLYPLEWAKLNHEVQAERAGDGEQRLFFMRSGWYGSSAFTPAIWAGDQRTDFESDDGLPTIIPLGISVGLAGVSTYGSDIAGYQSATNPPSTKELYLRWTSLGALSPVMRTHHGTATTANWRWDKDAETLAWFARWADFHIRLFPYLDGASVAAEQHGLPLMRALPLMFPDDTAGWSIDDEYVLGPSFLVAPIQVEGATSRAVHFPAGHWVSTIDATAIDGPMDSTVDAGMELPLYLLAGSIVPRLPEGVTTLRGAITVDRELWVVPGGDGSFTERDGTAYTLKQDASATLTLPACTGVERGCVDGDVIRLSGSGPLNAYGCVLTIQSTTARNIDVRFLK